MKKICVLLSLIVFFLFNSNVLAEEMLACTNDELSRVKEIAKKVEINYEYEFKEVNQNGEIIKYPVYSLVATNLNKDIKVLIMDSESSDNYREFKNGSEIMATLKGFNEGERIVVTIKAFTTNLCSGKVVRSVTIKLPYYNYFSEDELCSKYPEFKYCGEFTDQKICYDDFNNEITKYQNALEKTDNKSLEEDDSNLKAIIVLGVIGLLLITFIIIAAIVIKKIKRKNAL